MKVGGTMFMWTIIIFMFFKRFTAGFDADQAFRKVSTAAPASVDGSVDELFQKGLALGGTEALPLTDMQGVGRVGYLLDPDGNVFGVISPVLSDGTDVMGG